MELSEFGQKLMEKAQALRDEMIRNKEQCCINCRWSVLPAAFGPKDAVSANHYVHCVWGLSNVVADAWVGTFIDRKLGQPIMQHMAGTDCKAYELREVPHVRAND
jgi:hypothetical protein